MLIVARISYRISSKLSLHCRLKFIIMDDKLPKGWELIEEWEGSFIFENSKLSFSVNVDFEALLKEPYTIEFLHTKGYLKLVNFDEGVFKVTALNEAEALQKALLMMSFINKNIQWLLSTQSKME